MCVRVREHAMRVHVTFLILPVIERKLMLTLNFFIFVTTDTKHPHHVTINDQRKNRPLLDSINVKVIECFN